MVIEGIPATEGIVALARAHGVEMPICEGVYRVLFEGQRPVEPSTHCSPGVYLGGMSSRTVSGSGSVCQEYGRSLVAAEICQLVGGKIVSAADVRVGARRQQRADDANVTVLGRIHQRRSPVAIQRVYVCPQGDQRLNRLVVPGGRCKHQSSVAQLILCFDLRTAFHQVADGFYPTLMGGAHQRGQPRDVGLVHVPAGPS